MLWRASPAEFLLDTQVLKRSRNPVAGAGGGIDLAVLVAVNDHLESPLMFTTIYLSSSLLECDPLSRLAISFHCALLCCMD